MRFLKSYAIPQSINFIAVPGEECKLIAAHIEGDTVHVWVLMENCPETVYWEPMEVWLQRPGEETPQEPLLRWQTCVVDAKGGVHHVYVRMPEAISVTNPYDFPEDPGDIE